QQEALARCAGLLDSFEIIERVGELPALARSAANLRLQYGVPVFLSRLRVSADEAKEETRQRFAHFIQHGFFASDIASTSGLVGAEAADGLVFRVERDEAVWPSLNAIAKAIHPISARAAVHVRLADKNPAKYIIDDADTACRVADTVLAA